MDLIIFRKKLFFETVFAEFLSKLNQPLNIAFIENTNQGVSFENTLREIRIFIIRLRSSFLRLQVSFSKKGNTLSSFFKKRKNPIDTVPIYIRE
jgi:hypothetical protein